MFQSRNAVEIQQKYQAGERNFPDTQLRRVDLRGLNLSRANFQNADFSYANLRGVNFSGANLSGAYFNEADLTEANLTGANLTGASLIKTYLIKANLQRANLTKAYLTGAYLTKADVQNAYFLGAYLNSTQFSGANLQGAQYDYQTHFDSSFDPEKNAMKKVGSAQKSITALKITVAELLQMFNHLTQTGDHYLGPTMTTRYWQATRPQDDWLEQFEIDNTAKVTFRGSLQSVVTTTQLKLAQTWVIAFIKRCSLVVPSYTKMLDPSKLLFAITPNTPTNTTQKKITPDNALTSRSNFSKAIASV